MRKNIKLDEAENYVYQLSKKHNVPKPKLVFSFVKRSSWIHVMLQTNKTDNLLLITIREGRKTIPIKWLDEFFQRYLKKFRAEEEYWKQFEESRIYHGVAG